MDVRVIAACNADLGAYAAAGKFRSDLYYRLNTFPIRIPPLRERVEDIPVLARDLLAGLSRKLHRTLRITDEAMQALCRHTWPGNVRELRNVLEFSSYLTQEGVIGLDNLPDDLSRLGEKPAAASLAQRVREFERREIDKALARHGATTEGKRKAAAELGISLASLYNKLNEK